MKRYTQGARSLLSPLVLATLLSAACTLTGPSSLLHADPPHAKEVMKGKDKRSSRKLKTRRRGDRRRARRERRREEVNTPVNLKGVSFDELAQMRSPRLLDITALEQQITQSLSGLEALLHMSKMVGEEHAQRALSAQIEALKESLTRIRAELRSAPEVDYSVPPPPPVVQAPTTPTQPAQPERPKPMSAARLSQRWSELEGAPFRDEKMMIMRTIAREEHMTAEQAEVLIRTLSFSDDKKDALVALYPQLVDPEQVGRLYQLLDHASDRRKARKEVDRINLHRRQAQGR